MPREQLVLFTETLDERIPENHPVRLLDEILDRIEWTDWEGEYHGNFGHPPIHPSVMAKVLLFAMIRKIRSARQIEYSLKHSVDFMWLASGQTIDHTTLSEFRRKHPEQIKGLYRQLIKMAIDLGVAKLSELCIDGTRVRADSNRFKTLTAEKIDKLIAGLDEKIEKAMRELDANDELDDLFDDGQKADQLPPELADLNARKEQLDAKRTQLTEMDEQRRRDGIDPKKKPAQLPTTDSDSRILPQKEGGFGPSYTPMAVTETENGFIVGADVLIGGVEHLSLMPMLDAVEEDFETKPETVLADGAYGTGPNLKEAEQRGVELLSPIREPAKDNPADRDDLTQAVADEDLDRLPLNAQTKRFDKQSFVYDEKADCLHCPSGKTLHREGVEHVKRSGTTIERISYRCRECNECGMSDRCRKSAKSKAGRRVTRDSYETIRKRHSDRMQTPEAKERYKRRFHYGEVQFAVLKAALDLRRFLLRGIDGVRQEWLWGCTAYNLKKLMSLWGALRASLEELDAAAAALEG